MGSFLEALLQRPQQFPVFPFQVFTSTPSTNPLAPLPWNTVITGGEHEREFCLSNLLKLITLRVWIHILVDYYKKALQNVKG